MEKGILNHGVQWEALTSSKIKISDWISHITKSKHINFNNNYGLKEFSEIVPYIPFMEN